MAKINNQTLNENKEGVILTSAIVDAYFFIRYTATIHVIREITLKKALITGITGQDGSYLAELLLSKEYEVHGIIRRASSINTKRIDHIYHDLHGNVQKPELYLHYGDLTASDTLQDLIYNIRPDEIYHLGAQSHVRVSFDMPEFTGDVTGLGTTRILEAVRKSGVKARYYQASSSEMFGGANPPQNEVSLFAPRSPYAIAKLYAYWMTRNYREAYNLYACNGLLFNHESPRRGETFVTRKITRALAAIKAGKQKVLYLGNLDSLRDWGYAPEYVEAMWIILNHDQPDDFVIGTGESHTIREFLDEAFGYAGMDWHEYVKIDPAYFRPTEVDYLLADASKAKRELGWEPKVKFHELVRIMVDADMELLGLESPGNGKRILNERFTSWHRWDQQVVSMDNQ
jgi:GDPmannose 4,6-dehydratase